MITAANIRNSVPYLDGLDITVTAGAITGIIGPNGAGKTTLLKMLAGLMAPASGKIELDHKTLFEIPHSQRAMQIAYLEQHSFVHWPLTVRQLIALGRFPHRLSPANTPAIDKRVIEDVIDQVGVGKLVDRRFNELSGGERARVIMARALAVQAKYLLVDEPIASLDLNFQVEVMNILTSQAKSGTGVCVILHDLNLAAAYCKSLYLLDEGRLVCQGPAAKVLTQEVIGSTFGIQADVSKRQDQIIITPVYPRIT